MTDPRDPQPYDPFEGPPTLPPSEPLNEPPGGSPGEPPTLPPSPQPSAPPTTPAASPQPEYVIHHGPPHPAAFGGSFQDAPDPFGEATPASHGADSGEPRRGAQRWIIPVAALVVVAMVAAGAYFLFVEPDDDQPEAGSTTTSTQTEQSPSSAPSSEPSPEPSDGPDAEPIIAGEFEVNGTVQSYTGPPTGQLGAPPKTAGSPAFTTPQTWSIGDCADDTCQLSITPGEVTVTLELAEGTWTGQSTQLIACDLTGSTTAEATLLIEISADGTSATRTLSATCQEPISEVNSLTLTAK